MSISTDGMAEMEVRIREIMGNMDIDADPNMRLLPLLARKKDPLWKHSDQENRTVEIPISGWLKEKCAGLWDIYNSRSCDLERYAEEITGRRSLNEQKAYVKRNWDVTAIMEYHMDNIYASSSGAIKWAMERKSKFAMIKYLVEVGGSPSTLEVAQRDLSIMYNILERADGMDEARWYLIQSDYTYWGQLGLEELYSI